MDDYNKFISDNEFVESFLPCNSSKLNQSAKIIYKLKHTSCGHEVLEQCKNRHIGYFTCVTFYKDKNPTKKHLCNFFPVFVGSKLDKDIYKLLYPNVFDENNLVFNDLFGMIYVDASLCHFSNLLTNRKELIHRVKRGQGVYCLYIYDSKDRGHKLSIDDSNQITYRNHKGEERRLIQGDEKFDMDADFSVDSKHFNLINMKHSFSCLSKQQIDIDSIENKNILSPINILYRALVFAMRDPKSALAFLTRGEIEKFASLNISYIEKGVSNGKFSMRGKNFFSGAKHASSFNYKKLQPNQILLSKNTWDRSIVRPIPKNVSVSSIPKKTQYFLCLAEKSISIDSPNRWLTLLPEIIISNNVHMKKYRLLNYIIEKLIENKFFMHINENNTLNEQCVVLVSGGLITRYCVNNSIIKNTSQHLKMLLFIKNINPYVEIYSREKFMMLNLNPGIPFRQVCLHGINVPLSPLEIWTSFLPYLTNVFDTFSLFGPNCSETIKSMAQYITINKLMAAVNYSKNKYSCSRAQTYFELTNENICVYFDDITYNKKLKRKSSDVLQPIAAKRIKTNLIRHNDDSDESRDRGAIEYTNNIFAGGIDGDLKFNKTDSTFNMNILFSSHPQMTADSYVLDKDINIDCFIYQRSRFEFEYNSDVNIHFNDLSTTDFLIEKDTAGNVLKKFKQIMTIEKLGTALQYHCFPQIKLKIIETKNNSGYHYVIYKYFDEIIYLSTKAEDIDISVMASMEQNRRAFQKTRVDIITKIKVSYYNGIKPSEQCGQKGLLIKQDVSRYPKIIAPNVRPHIVGSIFSLIGRSPLIQLKSIKKKQIMNTEDCLFGNYIFVILKNISTATISPIRQDLYSNKCIQTNNCTRTQYTMLQQSYDQKEIGRILPHDNATALNILTILKKNVKIRDEYGNFIDSTKLMTKEDHLEVCKQISLEKKTR